MVAERRLPIVEAPIALCTPRVADLLVGVWDRAVVPALRASAEPVPADLSDFVEACRELARRRSSATGSSGDVEAPTGAESADGEITTLEAATRLDVGERQVRNLCRSGRLRARKVGRSWLVDAAAVEGRSDVRAADT